jgi:hypothetical protein
MAHVIASSASFPAARPSLSTRTNCRRNQSRLSISGVPKAASTAWSCSQSFALFSGFETIEDGKTVTRVQVISDSRYVIDNIPRASEWRKRGWRKRTREPVENSDLWKQFLSARSRVGMAPSFCRVGSYQADHWRDSGRRHPSPSSVQSLLWSSRSPYRDHRAGAAAFAALSISFNRGDFFPGVHWKWTESRWREQSVV